MNSCKQCKYWTRIDSDTFGVCSKLPEVLMLVQSKEELIKTPIDFACLHLRVKKKLVINKPQ